MHPIKPRIIPGYEEFVNCEVDAPAGAADDERACQSLGALEWNNPLETDLLKLNLPKTCSMDYYEGCLFIPDWNDDLIVLEKRH